MKPVNRLTAMPSIDDLVPTTSIDHLLSPEERLLARQAREAFEELGREMGRRQAWEATYRVLYDLAREQLAGGLSPDELRAEMAELADTDDEEFATTVRAAFEDVLAGRPPRQRA